MYLIIRVLLNVENVFNTKIFKKIKYILYNEKNYL